MSIDPSAVASQYFACLRARDLGVADLLHEDARPIGPIGPIGLASVKAGGGLIEKKATVGPR